MDYFLTNYKLLVYAFVIIVLCLLVYLNYHIQRLNKIIEQLTKASDNIRDNMRDNINVNIKQLLNTILENQLKGEVSAEKLHRNTRVLLLEAIDELDSTKNIKHK